MRIRLLGTGVLALALALGLSACGSDSGSSTGADGGGATADGGGSATADAGGTADVTAPQADAGQPQADAGQPQADAGQPTVDAGQPTADAGQPQADAGQPTADAGGTATTVTLADVNAQVFQPRCAFAGCHAASSNAGGLDLETDPYGALIDVTPVNQAAAAAGKKLVVPGDPENSFLYQKIAGTLADGEGQPMPIGASLDATQTQLVYDWIAQGANP